MSVTSTQVRVSYAGNGVTLAFTVPWYFLDEEALLVVVRTDATGAEAVKALTTDYTVTGTGNPAGGTVTMNAGKAPAAGETLHIIHAGLMTQGLDLTSGAVLPAEELEKALDRLTFRAQRANDKAERSPRLPETDTDGSGAYDAKSNRIKNLADPIAAQDAVTRQYALDNFATASGPGALPPDGSLTNVKWTTGVAVGDRLDSAKVEGLTAGEMGAETDPYPGAVLSASADLVEAVKRVQYQLRRIMESIDGVARAHGYVDPAASNYVPAAISAAIAALPTVQQNLIPNGSHLVSQRFPDEGATGTIATGLDVFVLDRWFILPQGGTITWTRVPTASLHSDARSPLGIELTGAAGITSVRYGIRLGRSFVRSLGALLGAKNVTFGCKVRHTGTTGTITPDFVVRTTSDPGIDSIATKFQAANMTARVTQAFPGALSSGNQVSFVHTFDLGAMTEGHHGIELYVDLKAMNAATIKFSLTDFFLAFGDITADLLPDDFDEQLEIAQTYYQKSFDYEVEPVQAVGSFTGTLAGYSDQSGANLGVIAWSHRRALRGIPTLVTYNPGAAATSARTLGGANAALGATRPGKSQTSMSFNGPITEAPIFVHATVDAEWYD